MCNQSYNEVVLGMEFYKPHTKNSLFSPLIPYNFVQVLPVLINKLK